MTTNTLSIQRQVILRRAALYCLRQAAKLSMESERLLRDEFTYAVNGREAQRRITKAHRVNSFCLSSSYHAKAMKLLGSI